jgi:predicted PurR-regulated permease PerM
MARVNSDAPTRKVRIEIAPSAIVWLLGTIAAVWLLVQLRVVVLLIVVALVIAGTVNPVVDWIERRGLRRPYALVLLFVVSILTTVLLLFLTLPPLSEHLAGIVRDAPQHRDELIAFLQHHTVTAPLAHLVEGVAIQQTFASAETYLMGYSSRAFSWLAWAATALALSFYVLADGVSEQGVLYAVVPRRYHMRLARIVHNLETIVGGYMRGQLITSLAIGTFTFLVLLACRVPHPLALALFAAAADVIPFVGGLLATVPAALSALPRGVPVATFVLVALFTYQEFENRLLVPRIYGRSLRLAPTTVVLALIIGGILLGVVGALLALPVAAGLQMMLKELRVEMPGDDSEDPSDQARDARTEATYERMSAGATAPEAGQIARHLADKLRHADAAVPAPAAPKGAR